MEQNLLRKKLAKFVSILYKSLEAHTTGFDYYPFLFNVVAY